MVSVDLRHFREYIESYQFLYIVLEKHAASSLFSYIHALNVQDAIIDLSCGFGLHLCCFHPPSECFVPSHKSPAGDNDDARCGC